MVKSGKPVQNEKQNNQENQTFVSFVKDKINHKLNKLKKSFEERIFSDRKTKFVETKIEKDSIFRNCRVIF